jgi:AcrR family transcriptional regulator
MTAKDPTIPRKGAKQARARATIDAILEATAHILIRDGYDRLTTNHVAREAGVSIGSIYQYFPSKDALVAALVDRQLDRMLSVIAPEVAEAIDEPFDKAIDRLVRALMRAHEVEPELYRAVLEQVPRVGRLERIREIDRHFEALLAASLEARRRELTTKDTRLAAFMIVRSAKAIVIAAMLEHPEYVKDGRLARELGRMVRGYLARGP